MPDIAIPCDRLLCFLEDQYGVDFANYRPLNVAHAITRRMELVRIADYRAYVDYLCRTPEEAFSLFKSILTNHTSFFRNPEVWSALASQVIPGLLRRKAPREPLRIWSAGCATGQEVYSLAMMLAEVLGHKRFAAEVIIYATDVNVEALQQTRSGRYPARATRYIPAPLLERHFAQDGRYYVASELLRSSVVAQARNLIDDAPFAGIDLLLCRNTLVYLSPAARARALSKLHAALAPQGALVLGTSEILEPDQNFQWLSPAYRIATKGLAPSRSSALTAH